jgi:hypothetical protein
MGLYFFDMRVGAELLADKDGLELPNLKAVQKKPRDHWANWLSTPCGRQPKPS